MCVCPVVVYVVVVDDEDDDDDVVVCVCAFSEMDAKTEPIRVSIFICFALLSSIFSVANRVDYR
jgi:hypothetical protein